MEYILSIRTYVCCYAVSDTIYYVYRVLCVSMMCHDGDGWAASAHNQVVVLRFGEAPQ